jgi:hypothetical protein
MVTPSIDGDFDVSAIQYLGGLLPTVIASIDAGDRLHGLRGGALLPYVANLRRQTCRHLERSGQFVPDSREPLSVLPDALRAYGPPNICISTKGFLMRVSGGSLSDRFLT